MSEIHGPERKSCKEIGHTDDQLCSRHDEPKKNQKKQFLEKKAVILCNQSDVVELLIPHPEVIYSKKKQTNGNLLTVAPYMQSSIYNMTFSLCSFKFYHQCSPLFLVFAAEIFRLKY